MKRLVSIITIFFCFYSIFAVTLERKTVYIIGGKGECDEKSSS